MNNQSKLQRLLCVAVCFFCIGIMTAFAQEQKVTVELKNATLKQVFKSIEGQTTYRFSYRNTLVDDKNDITISKRQVGVSVVLNEALKGRNLTYTIVSSKSIVISDLKEQSAPSKNKRVSGTVKSANGESIIGANVKVTGTTIGCITDIDGNFTLEVPENAKLTVSYIGFQTQEVAINGKSSVDIMLTEDTEMLEEVVVIGYGSIKKKDLTGSVSSVGARQVEERQTMNLSNALQGSMPGVYVTRNSGQPGENGSILIRGVTTIGNTSPLIIADGIPISSIDAINPNDVESISVLKDAASAAIYGSRAAAGVVIITTKQAKEKKLSFDYSFELGVETMPVHPEYMDAIDYMRMENELRWNDAGNGENQYPTYDKNIIDNYNQLHIEDPDSYPNTDWFNEVIKSSAPRTSHSLSISGGTDRIKSYTSFGYDKIDGLYNNLSKERYTFRSNNYYKVNKFISADINFSFRRIEDNKPNNNTNNNVFRFLNMARPIDAAFWKDGRYAPGRDGGSLVALIDKAGFYKRVYTEIYGKFALNATPVDGLKISAIFSPNFVWNKNKNFVKKVPHYSAEDPNLIVFWNPAQTSLEENRTDNMDLTGQFLVNYMKSIKKHNLNILTGYETHYDFNESLGAGRSQFDLSNYPYINIGNPDFQSTSGGASESAYKSIFGRIIYNYNQKYHLQLNIRGDASSNFHKEHRWGVFPSISSAWTISEEKFMQKTRKWLDHLKFRISYGVLGNDRIGAFAYMAKMGYGNCAFVENGKVVVYQTSSPSNYPIKDITWEKTKTFDIGFDAAFLQNKLRVTLDYFRKKTSDMLLAVQIPTFIGYGNPTSNAGEMTTRGVDLDINWNNNIGDFNYSIGVNFSDSKSIMGNMAGTEMIGNYIKAEGTEFDEWYGYIAEGIYQTEDEIQNSATLNSSVQPGDLKYKDISGPNGKPDGIISAAYDKVPLGGSLPRFTFGGNVFAEMNGVDLSFAFQGVGKRNAYLSTYMIAPMEQNTGNAPTFIKDKYWSHYNTPEENKAAIYPRLTYKDRDNNYVQSSYWLFNGAYFRMKNITLGYTIPQLLIKKVGLDKLRIYASINDPFAFSHFPKGWAPETTDKQMNYPFTVSYILGINVKF